MIGRILRNKSRVSQHIQNHKNLVSPLERNPSPSAQLSDLIDKGFKVTVITKPQEYSPTELCH